MPPPVIGFSPGLSIIKTSKPKMGFVMKTTTKAHKKRKMKASVGLNNKRGGKFKKRKSVKRKRKRKKKKKQHKFEIPSEIPPLQQFV